METPDTLIPSQGNPVKPRPGFKVIAEFNPDVEPIVGIIAHKSRVFVATSCRVLEVVGDELKSIVMHEEIKNGNKTE